MSSTAGAPPRALLLNGTVGVGKTTVAEAVGDLLRRAGTPNAVIDVDALCQAWPSPPDDPFHAALALRNLTAVAHNHVAAGAERLVVAGVVETVQERTAHEEAIGTPATLVRLRADAAVVRERLVRRHAATSESRAWHLRRAPELEAILEAADVDHHCVDVTDMTPEQAATDIVSLIGW